MSPGRLLPSVLPRNIITGDNVTGVLKKWGHLRNKRAMMALGRSPEYHWNQIISKSVHWFSRSHLKLFLAAILFN